MEYEVEQLDISQKAEVLDVLRPAFATHPILPAGMPAQATERMLELMIDTFSVSGKFHLFGIRKEGSLACASFCIDPNNEPKGLSLVIFSMKMLRVFGLRFGLSFMHAYSKRVRHEKPYLELLLLGTLPDFHGQGLGRMMLRFLYEFSEKQGYHGVILDVAQDTPAYGFYLKEGFIQDKEIHIRGISLCSMRRDNTRAAAESTE